MSERRNFLKAASLLPLIASDPEAAAASFQSSNPPPPGDPAPAMAGEKAAPLPNPPDVTEKHFPNYHLLGQPDADSNLLGTERPRDWQATKAQLMRELQSAASPDDPIHKWLHTFSRSFDDLASEIVLNSARNVLRDGTPTELKYEPQLYDSSLRSASGLLDRCLRYRNEMGTFELSGVGAGISYLVFLKTKPFGVGAVSTLRVFAGNGGGGCGSGAAERTSARVRSGSRRARSLDWRFPASAPGAFEPDRQRDQVHQARRNYGNRASLAVRSPRINSGSDLPPLRCARHRSGDIARPLGQDLRSVHSSRQFDI
jgi:hypothetical protein